MWRRKHKQSGPPRFYGYEMTTRTNGLVELRCGRDSCPFHIATADHGLLITVALTIHPRFCRGREEKADLWSSTTA